MLHSSLNLEPYLHRELVSYVNESLPSPNHAELRVIIDTLFFLGTPYAIIR